MGWLFKSKSKSTDQTPASDLFRAVEFNAYPAGEETQLVRAADREEVQLLPAFVVDFLESCDQFVPFDEQLTRYAAFHEMGDLEIQSLQTWLPRLNEMNLFISAEQLRAACTHDSSVETPRGKIEMIGFPTGDSPARLRRALESFAANARTHGRKVHFVVATNFIDDGKSRGVAEEIGRTQDLQVAFIGEKEKRELAQRLRSATGCDPAVLEFALFDPEGCGFLCGANRNVLLLRGAGKLFSSVDDDMVCKISTAPEPSGDSLKCFARRDVLQRWFYPDRASTLADANHIEADYLGVHEEWLGQAMSECFSRREKVVFENLSNDVIRRLRRRDAAVAMTCSGHVGDPGIPTSYYHLLLRGDSLRRLTKSEPFYRTALGARSVRSVAPEPSIGDATLSPGMAIGLDGRDLLPPFFPVLHAEDFPYGPTVWQCIAGGFLAHLPCALNHEPAEGKPVLKPGDLNETNRATIFEFAHLMRQLIFEFQPSLSDEGTGARMAALGRHVRGVGEASANEFDNYLRDAAMRLESTRIRYLEERLRDEGDGVEFWRRDVEDYLDHLRGAFTHDDFDIPYDLKSRGEPRMVRRLMQRLIARYGHLLEAWPAIFHAAKELND